MPKGRSNRTTLLKAGLVERRSQLGSHCCIVFWRKPVQDRLHSLLDRLQSLMPDFADLVGPPGPAFAEQRGPFGFLGGEY